MPYIKINEITLEECPERLFRKVTGITAKYKDTTVARVVRIDDYDDNYDFLNSSFETFLYSSSALAYLIFAQSKGKDELNSNFITENQLQIINELESLR